ncbi:unnamed protein product [Rotaria magnacalcarata]|uniref:Uncharacterized protein n=1 Tax=Rotaria magnacalcarata TaxID=392030 RepID=A0A8S2NRG6_9BILA|nr:unnamed protein product [Rotaria magnacalcarata]CAF4032451.1 unnamed protein product [Rotaria magnacalcarata]
MIVMNKKQKVSCYHRFIKSYVAIFKGTKGAAFLHGNEKWRNMKTLGDDKIIEKEITRLIIECKAKRPDTLFSVWARTTNVNPNSTQCSLAKLKPIEIDRTVKINNSNASPASNSSPSSMSSNRTTVCHAQTLVRKELEELNNIRGFKLANFISEDTRLSQAKHRNNKRLKMKRLIEKHPNVAQEYNLSLYDQTGQPRVEQRAQSALLNAIVEIASRGAAADSTRNPDLISPCMTLDDLSKRIKLRGFVLSRSTTYLSQDDKARVPIGLPATRRQAPLFMHLNYKIRLPDHDFVVAPRHKLIPLVYVECTINDKKEVSYSGSTYITIRSGKHDSSTAETHNHDFSLLFGSKEFEPVMKVNGKCKPIVIICVDGGPDENPRYSETLAGGLILPYDHYGSHLDNGGNTIDTELEIRNFKRAGNCLAEVWGELTIDSYPVVCQYVEPVDKKDLSSALNANALDLHWLQAHVRQSQYLLQIIKCNDLKCCSKWRTNYFKIISEGYIPAPFSFKVSPSGISVAELNNKDGRFVDLFQRLQFDSLLPTTNVAYD